MQQLNPNTLNNAKKAIDNMFSPAQKQEIINAIKNTDKRKLQTLVSQLNVNQLNEKNLQNMLKNVSKDEIIRLLKGV